MRHDTVVRIWALAALGIAGSVGVASAQVSSDDRSCIVTFNKAVRDVAKAQSKIAAKCLQRFASGSLATTAETCLVTDVAGQLQRKIAAAERKVASACATGTPPFGTSTPADAAIARAAVGEVDQLHATIGDDLDDDLVPAALDASCQSRVAAALLKCVDARWKVFLKCQKIGLAAGTLGSGAALATSCLPIGESSPFDPGGQVAKLCAGRLAAVVAQRCAGVNLLDAFPAVATTSSAALVDAVVVRSRCQMCRVANDVDGLARDCDAFDDGNAANGTCGAECADGVVQTEEPCDDGNTSGGDGCSPICHAEPGWACTGSPSVCMPTCGNGHLDAGEGCDDGGTAGGDGCSSTCGVEARWSCTGQPSVCTPHCGDGTLASGEGEACDDGDRTGGDGCSATCQVEDGWLCAGSPSVCTFVCGNGTFQSGETCDDGNAVAGDGCSAACRIEPGWLCSGQPSHCTPLCGDGLVRGGETCDDGDATSGDGCSFQCQTEAGFVCAGQPSNCQPICGDGFKRGLETCDDHNTIDGDGCSGTFCRQEQGWTCLGQPSVCTRTCGDGDLDPLEQCDDGNHVNGDGCNASCRSEPGYACGGQPSVCVLTCGNGVLDAAETCDDGNATSGDGCSASCKNEPGWYCAGPGLACQPFEIVIDGPAHGTFTTAGTTSVAGHYTVLPAAVTSVTVNGVTATVNTANRTFTAVVPLSAPAILNPIRATLTNTATGDAVDDRIVIVDGPSVADGSFSPQSVALRMNDTGIDSIEPLVSDLAAGQFDLATLVPTGTEILPWQCYFQFIWCWAGASAHIGSPAPSFSGVRFDADSKTNAVAANVHLDNLRIDIDIDGTGIVPDCGLRLTADHLDLSGDYTLSPDPLDASKVDVNLTNLTGVSFGNFQRQFTYGNCGLVSSRLGNVEQLASDAIAGFIDDPDGAGPADSPLADAIEQALSGVSIAGAVGSGLGLHLDAPLFTVAEDNAGITFGADSRFTVSVGNGPGQCVPPPGAPNLTASYAPPETFPTYGATTPVSGIPYGVGVSISTAGMNQLLRGQTECGLMRTTLTTIDLDGPGGVAPLPITAGLLSLLAPEFGELPSSTPLQIEVSPTMAPLVTGAAGPSGELTELRIAQVMIDVVGPGGVVWLSGAFDARLGMGLDFMPDGSGLSVTLSEPAAADTSIVILYNPLGADAAQLETVLPAIIRPMIPDLAGALASFPLPQFFGLTLQGVEVSRSGQFMTMFANLEEAP